MPVQLLLCAPWCFVQAGGGGGTHPTGVTMFSTIKAATVAELPWGIMKRSDRNKSGDSSHSAEAEEKPKVLSLCDRLCGVPSDRDFFDSASVTTTEAKYSVHPKIAEFWCCATSVFYASSLLAYLIPHSSWWLGWVQLGHLPAYVHLTIALGLLTAVSSTLYHAVLWEGLGSIDCSIAVVMATCSTLTNIGLPFVYQFCIFIGLMGVFAAMWRRATALAMLLAVFVYPLSVFSCILFGWRLGALSFGLLFCGNICFLLDRSGKYPLHSLWHILSGASILVSTAAVVMQGPGSSFFEGREWY